MKRRTVSLLVLTYLAISLCSNYLLSQDGEFDLLHFKNVTYKGIRVYKSCKEVSQDHPLLYFWGHYTPTFRLEYTDDFLKQIGVEAIQGTIGSAETLVLDTTVFSEEWIAQNSDTSVIKDDSHLMYTCTMKLNHIYNPCNRLFFPYWHFVGDGDGYEKEYYPQHWYVDQIFWWTDEYMLDGDQSGEYTQYNTIHLDDSYGGKGCMDHIVPKNAVQYYGEYYFRKIFPHESSDVHLTMKNVKHYEGSENVMSLDDLIGYSLIYKIKPY